MLFKFDREFSGTHKAKESELNGRVHVCSGERVGWLGIGNEAVEDIECDGGSWFAGTVTIVPLNTSNELLSDWGFQGIERTVGIDVERFEVPQVCFDCRCEEMS